MKTAKFAVCSLLTLLIIAFSFGAHTQVYARASDLRYARADSREVYFCEEKDINTARFAIPYTYCVEVLAVEGEWYYVKYAEDSSLYRARFGYCLTDGLTLISQPPEHVYLNMPVTVTFRTDAPSGSLPVLNELNVTAAYYGAYRSGASDYSYVLYDGTFGYVYGANDDYPLNEISDTPPPDDEPEKKGANTTLIIALVLTGLAVSALLVLYFTGRRKSYRPDK